jgi:hypothetical protein
MSKSTRSSRAGKPPGIFPTPSDILLPKRQSLVFLNVPTMRQPEACQFIRGFMNAFAEWVADYGPVADIAS